MEKKVELLAPAGNKESFLGAVHAGADAVYLGGEKFGARAYADNFTEAELCDCIKYAHLFGRKVYLTLNTLVKEKEMRELYAYLAPYYEAGLDGVIIQDMGVFLYVKEHFPGLSLHVSTQMAITGAKGADKLKALGAERIVPARELSLEEIRLIKETVDIEIESFIHGAMCYCYSGQCLFSSLLGGRSGNRGRCAQPCRLPYRIGNRKEKEAYYLSLKDMCTIEMLPMLIEAGIDSFKIEGRMKKPEYAAGVTSMYRKYIDLYYEMGAESYAVSREDRELLKSLYIRSEIGEGYYKKHNSASMVTVEKPSYSGSDEKLLQVLREKYIENTPKIAVKGKAVFLVGKPALLQLETVGSGDKKEYSSVTTEGNLVQEAVKQPMKEEAVRKQLEKFGNTVFTLKELSVEMESNIFMPLKELNELRRQAISLLEEQMIQKNGLSYEERKGQDTFLEKAEKKDKRGSFENGIYVTVQKKEQLHAVFDWLKENGNSCVKTVIISSDLYETESGIIRRNEEYKCTEEMRNLLSGNVYVAYPYVMRSKDYGIHEYFKMEEMFDGILVRNMEELSLLQQKDYAGKVITDAGLYIWNRKAEQFFKEEAQLLTMPLELNSKELNDLDEKEHLCIVYGRLPMMITANCLRKTTGKCLQTGKIAKDGNTEEFVKLIDRMGKEFPVYTNCRHCYNVIYNSVPLSLHKKVSREEGKYRLDFTTEDARETKRILQFFCNIYQKKEENPPYREYTTGHEKRGVE